MAGRPSSRARPRFRRRWRPCFRRTPSGRQRRTAVPARLRRDARHDGASVRGQCRIRSSVPLPIECRGRRRLPTRCDCETPLTSERPAAASQVVLRRGPTGRAKPRMTVASASRHARSSSPSGRFLSTAPRSSAFARPSSIALNSTAASATDFSPSKPAASSRPTLADELVPRARPRGRELGACLHARNGALERDAIERRMLEHERTEAVQAEVDEIGHRVVRLLERADPLEQELEGSLRDRVDEKAFPRSEDAVDGPGRGAGLARDSADGEGCRDHHSRRGAQPPLAAPARVSSSCSAGDPWLTSYRHVLRYA